MMTLNQGVTKRCSLSWLTNSVLVYEPKCGGSGGVGLRGLRLSANEYSCAHGAQINFGDLTPYLTYGGEGCYTSDLLCWLTVIWSGIPTDSLWKVSTRDDLNIKVEKSNWQGSFLQVFTKQLPYFFTNLNQSNSLFTRLFLMDLEVQQ
jgi:hypothetical protein